MLDRGAVVLPLELLDQRLHLLGLAARADQHGIAGRHHDHVVEPDHRGKHRVLGAHETVVAVEHDHRTFCGVAGLIVIAKVPHRAPAADIRPTEIGGNHGGELGALHDHIVDRFLRRARSARMQAAGKSRSRGRYSLASPEGILPANKSNTRVSLVRGRVYGPANCARGGECLPKRGVSALHCVAAPARDMILW